LGNLDLALAGRFSFGVSSTKGFAVKNAESPLSAAAMRRVENGTNTRASYTTPRKPWKRERGDSMSIFKRGSVYWYHFLFNGEHIQKSTKQGNPRTARQIEAAHRTSLAKGEVGITERKVAPLFSVFAQRFIAHVETRHENKPQTVVFYASKLSRLLEFAPIANVRIDRIEEGTIEEYVVARRATVGPATVNRELATLRRMLRLAHEWKEIQRVPRIRLLTGERVRDFVLSRKQEEIYLAACRQPLYDIAVLMLETGLRIGGNNQSRMDGHNP